MAAPPLRRPRGPTRASLLDQAWLRFDIEHTVFVTAGKQHVKWGTARFWNPTDFLPPQRRDPLAVFDARTGASMLKLHVPWEAKGWNFYGIGLLDNAGPRRHARPHRRRAPRRGGAGRDRARRQRRAPARPQAPLRVRLSSALGPFDVYGELALRLGSEIDRLPLEPVARQT